MMNSTRKLWLSLIQGATETHLYHVNSPCLKKITPRPLLFWVKEEGISLWFFYWFAYVGMDEQSPFLFKFSLKDTLAHGQSTSSAYGKKEHRALQAAINQMWHGLWKLFGVLFRCNLKCGHSLSMPWLQNTGGPCSCFHDNKHLHRWSVLEPLEEIKKKKTSRTSISLMAATGDLWPSSWRIACRDQKKRQDHRAEGPSAVSAACCYLNLQDCTTGLQRYGEVSPGEFPGRGGEPCVGGMVCLLCVSEWGGGGVESWHTNPSGLAATRPRDKLSWMLWTFKNATWTCTFFETLMCSSFRNCFSRETANYGKIIFVILLFYIVFLYCPIS